MKKNASFLFVLLYVLAMLRPVAPLFEYIIYEDYITEFLCINKQNIELECNGKCYLMQRLAEQEDEKKQNLPKIALEDYPIGFVEFTQSLTGLNPQKPKSKLLFYKNQYRFLFSKVEFHPPSLSS